MSTSTEAQTQTENCPKFGEFGWNELLTKDPAASKNFYTKLFGWKTEPFGADYTIWKSADSMAGGMMKMPDAPSGWLAYVVVENCDASARKAKELGAKLCVEPKDIPTVGRIAVFTDPQGAALGLFQPEKR